MVAGIMPRIPGSQSRAVMKEKAERAIQLYERGLTFRQIRVQVNCSQKFLSKVIAQHRQTQQETSWEGTERRGRKDRRATPRTPWDRRSDEDRRGRPLYQRRIVRA